MNFYIPHSRIVFFIQTLPVNSKRRPFDQLEKELKRRNSFHTDRIELINPDAKKRLDQRLINDFWFPIRAAIKDGENSKTYALPRFSAFAT